MLSFCLRGFRLPAEDRKVSLQSIAERTKLTVDGAEFLLMKALSLHLIEGIIDEVDQSVQVRPPQGQHSPLQEIHRV